MNVPFPEMVSLVPKVGFLAEESIFACSNAVFHLARNVFLFSEMLFNESALRLRLRKVVSPFSPDGLFVSRVSFAVFKSSLSVFQSGVFFFECGFPLFDRNAAEIRVRFFALGLEELPRDER